MSEKGLEKNTRIISKERAQYGIGLALIVVMLIVAGFPLFLLAFVGAISFLLFKVIESGRGSTARRVFEFYIEANQILRSDSRRWYGFEIREILAKGEAIAKQMIKVPPLVHFALGSIYNKIGEHEMAVGHLSLLNQGTSDAELSILEPDRELREYVDLLRKIESFPAESPQTSSSIRTLERLRKNQAANLLEESRQRLESGSAAEGDMQVVSFTEHYLEAEKEPVEKTNVVEPLNDWKERKPVAQKTRKPITEVLHDIYDSKAN